MSAYVDGELTGAEMLAIRRHLSECAECAAEYESMRLVKQAVARLRTVVPRKDFAASILHRLDDVQVAPYQRLADWALRFAHGKLSPVAAALAACGVAIVLMTAGGIDGLAPDSLQNAAMATFASQTREVAFLSEISRPRVEFGAPRPLVVASEKPEMGAEVHFTSFPR
jgi:anti-sigma factor RsiW